ncbi:UNVERIFIED_CONTAM: hypothetical protein Sangu_0399200 [Sesamum angustifolium]|uniref:Uncharacterized protein n=1 Tax=Sesamum angustifolium TaxID=2727405 RepID=A0AAW2QTW1_9LAMI
MKVIGCRQGTGNSEAAQIWTTSLSPRQESRPRRKGRPRRRLRRQVIPAERGDLVVAPRSERRRSSISSPGACSPDL